MAMILTIVCFATTLLILACTQRVGALRHNNAAYSSKNFKEGRFHNLASTRLSTHDGNMLDATIDFFRGSPDRVPANDLPAVRPALDKEPAHQNMGVTWFGHSTCLIQIDGQIVLTDPVFSDRASPFSFVGPKRFATEIDFQPEDLPERIDAVIVSHDHYDHLDYQTIQGLKERVHTFYVPLGVAAQLHSWGVPEERIVELDWWEEISHGPLTLLAAVDSTASGGEFYGPEGFMEMKGHPKRVKTNKRAQEQTVASRLWDVSEQLTGVRYPVDKTAQISCSELITTRNESQ